jgi:hypothetical protein
MDVLNIFESILYRYVSTLGLKPHLVQPAPPIVSSSDRPPSGPLYTRKPEPPSSRSFSPDKISPPPSLAGISSRSTLYVEETSSLKIDLQVIVD